MFKGILRAVMALVLAGAVSASFANENNVIIFKTGSYTVSETTQTIVSGTSVLTEDADSEFGFEYERRLDNNIAIGGELISYSNKYARSGVPGEIESLLVTFNAKKYFDAAKHVKPFVGAGIGAAAVDVSGPIVGNAGGVALQLMAGAEFTFNRFGLFLEYKLISAEPEDSAGSKVDISGDGLFFGAAIHF